MFKSLEVLQTSMAMASHAGSRQALTAANLANADTPGYRAQTIAPFSDSFDGQLRTSLRNTRANHIAPSGSSAPARVTFTDSEASPNGNTVSVEQEMLNAVEVQREHDRALTIYKHSLDVLRLSIGRR